jgi:hypothetical protein
MLLDMTFSNPENAEGRNRFRGFTFAFSVPITVKMPAALCGKQFCYWSLSLVYEYLNIAVLSPWL